MRWLPGCRAPDRLDVPLRGAPVRRQAMTSGSARPAANATARRPPPGENPCSHRPPAKRDESTLLDVKAQKRPPAGALLEAMTA